MKPTVDFRVTCPICQETVVVKVKQSEYDKWQDGMLIGDAMPSVSRDDRERLMTGLCPKDWDKLMSDPSETVDPHEDNDNGWYMT